jgi:hypothetical protein
MTINWNDLVARFNSQTLAKEEWTHAAHLVTALWHLLEYGDVERALCYLRPRIILRNYTVGTKNTDTGGYHETITVFWLQQVYAFVQCRSSRDFNVLVGLLLDEPNFFEKDYILGFYSRETLRTPRARGMYIAP